MTGPFSVFFSILVLGGLLLLGTYLRARLKIFQFLFLPSSIIAGFIGLFLGPYMLDFLPKWLYPNWSSYSGLLINVVFATLFLGVVLPDKKEIWNKGGSMLCFGVITGFGQYAIALLVTALILIPLFHVPSIFATILEIGFSGGHGTAAGMTKIFTELGFPAGGALGQMSATVGIFFAVVGGITLINIGIRQDKCKNLNFKKGIPVYKKTGILPKSQHHSIALGTVATESIEPLTFHFAIIAIAIMLGWVFQKFLVSYIPIMKSFPLFPLAMLGGLCVQFTCVKLKVDDLLDKGTFDRIMGWALDFLVASAIASLRFDLFLQNILPFGILMIAGMLWLLFMVLFMAPRMFPEYYFERSITEFGMQSGVTAIGILLLRLVDPEYKTGTAEAFGMKQMVYEPFLGGGFVTALSPLFIVHFGLWSSFFIIIVIMLIFFLLAVFSGWTSFLKNNKNQ